MNAVNGAEDQRPTASGVGFGTKPNGEEQNGGAQETLSFYQGSDDPAHTDV